MVRTAASCNEFFRLIHVCLLLAIIGESHLVMVCSIPRKPLQNLLLRELMAKPRWSQAEMEPRGAACGFSARLGWRLVMLHYCSIALGRLTDQPIASARRIKRLGPVSYSAGTSTYIEAKGGILVPCFRLVQQYFEIPKAPDAGKRSRESEL